jgi:hypothetical protein
MTDYRTLMMQTHREAMVNYTFDPRERFDASRMSSNNVQTFNSTRPESNTMIRPEDYAGEPFGSRADENSVQASPNTRSFKRYVIIDASQRDWVKQPNPYTNLTFSFGSQATVASNPIVYTNNPFVPTFAVEQASNVPPLVGIYNNRGWSLDTGSAIVYYRAYDPNLPPGIPVGTDTGYIIQPSGVGFGSSGNINNVASLRLVRAVLPQRQFLSIPIDPSTSGIDASTSQFIQSNLIGKPYSTFATYPYLLFNVNEFFGQYLGGNDQIRRSFSVMTQKQRQQANFQTDIGVQQYDYEPWGQEALTFQSPITNLKRLEVTITDPIGTNFTQNDNLTISLIQATSNHVYLNCFTPNAQYFSSNDLRVGDRVTFYPETLSNMLKSPLLSVLNADKSAFIRALGTTTFPVLQLLDYVTNPLVPGEYIPRDASSARTTPYVSSYNGFVIPNFVTIETDGDAVPTYPGSIEPVTNEVIVPSTLLSYLTTDPAKNTLPFLNTSLQPVYTLELETLEPDTSKIGGKIVVPR